MLSSSEIIAIIRRMRPFGAVRPLGSLSFVLHTHRREETVAASLEGLRRIYPDVPVTVLSDGPAYTGLSEICGNSSSSLVEGEKLKIPGKGAWYTTRYLKVLRDHGCDWGIKIDPDTRIHRAFRYPGRGEICGTLLGLRGDRRHIQGGCMAFSRSALEKLTSQTPEAVARFNQPASWCVSPSLRRKLNAYETRTGEANTNFLVHAMAAELGLSIADWPEVLSLWNSLSLPVGRLFAASHPWRG